MKPRGAGRITAGAYALTQIKTMKRRPRVVARFAAQMLARALT